MARLGKEERAFCKYHGIPLERLFNATGFRPSQYAKIMKADEKWAAYGVTPCSLAGHVLRNRHGTCLMCNTERLAYLFRTKMSGYLYIWSGADETLMKLGFSGDPFNRLKIGNYEGWGGYRDWRLRAYAWDSRAGSLESKFHSEFGETRVLLPWTRNGFPAVAREAFEIDMTSAVTTMTKLCDGFPEIIPPPFYC